MSPTPSPLPPPGEQIGVSAAASKLGVHVSAVYRWIASGRLRAWRVVGRWRLTAADVAALVERTGGRKEGAAGPARPAVPSRAEAERLLSERGYTA
jgi:excisionase family DNA binding protein